MGDLRLFLRRVIVDKTISGRATAFHPGIAPPFRGFIAIFAPDRFLSNRPATPRRPPATSRSSVVCHVARLSGWLWLQSRPLRSASIPDRRLPRRHHFRFRPRAAENSKMSSASLSGSSSGEKWPACVIRMSRPRERGSQPFLVFDRLKDVLLAP